MSFLELISSGPGLAVLIGVLLAALAGVGIVAWRSSRKTCFGEILLPSSLIAFSLIFLVITFSFPAEEAGPAAVPRLWIFWTIVLCAAILQQVLRGKIKAGAESGRLGFLLLVTLILIGYYFAIETIGYFLSSFLFLVILMHILAFKKKWLFMQWRPAGSFFLTRFSTNCCISSFLLATLNITSDEPVKNQFSRSNNDFLGDRQVLCLSDNI